MKFHKLWLFIPATIVILIIVFAALGSMAGDTPPQNPSAEPEDSLPVMTAEFQDYPEQLNYYDNKLTSPDDPEWFIAVRVIQMTEQDEFTILEDNVESQSEFSDGWGIYLLLGNEEKHVYLKKENMPDYLLFFIAGTTVSEQELYEITGNTVLLEAEERSSERNITWDEFITYMESMKETVVQEFIPTIVNRNMLEAIAAVGESISVRWEDESGECVVSATLTDVQWLNSLGGILTEEEISALEGAADAEGNLYTDTVRYIFAEDGSSNSEVITSEEDRSQSFLYYTVTYRNTSDREIVDPTVCGKVLLLEELGEGLIQIDTETPQKGDEWTYVIHSSKAAANRELCWWSPAVEREEGTEVIRLAPGEEITVYHGILLDMEFEPYAYLSLDQEPLDPARFSEENYLDDKSIFDIRVME